MLYFDDTEKPLGNQIIRVTRVENIGAIPISLDEAKTQLRVTYSDDDPEITVLIKKAIRHVENHCNISIIYQRIEMIGRLEAEQRLPYGPVIGIESVGSSSGPTGSAPVTYSSAESGWSVDGDLFDTVNCLRYRIVYTAGNYLPDDLKDVCLQVLTFLYENRGKDVKTEDLKSILNNASNYFVPLWI